MYLFTGHPVLSTYLIGSIAFLIYKKLGGLFAEFQKGGYRNLNIRRLFKFTRFINEPQNFHSPISVRNHL